MVRQVTEGGRGRAVPVVLGTATGLYVHATLAVAGLSALVTHSSQAFTAVKLAGAAYLVGLGVWTWRSTVPSVPSAPSAPSASPPLSRSHRRLPELPDSIYLQALLADVLNPKAASVYLTLMPQFVTPGEPLGGQILILATAHALTDRALAPRVDDPRRQGRTRPAEPPLHGAQRQGHGGRAHRPGRPVRHGLAGTSTVSRHPRPRSGYPSRSGTGGTVRRTKTETQAENGPRCPTPDGTATGGDSGSTEGLEHSVHRGEITADRKVRP
ncbi:LysE family translocator [Streptosporangium sp. NPDC023825]|uniref:LysE family translocator n=1 Tax=Streptosporangium sp. NPDC023825 TaxID=3154909 RepID=UPI0034405F74